MGNYAKSTEGLVRMVLPIAWHQLRDQLVLTTGPYPVRGRFDSFSRYHL